MLKKLFAVTTLATMSGAVFAADAPALPFGLSFSGSVAVTTDYRLRRCDSKRKMIQPYKQDSR